MIVFCLNDVFFLITNCPAFQDFLLGSQNRRYNIFFGNIVVDCAFAF